MPYIEISLKDNSHKRVRRTTGLDCTETSLETRCCRYPFVVNFEEFGWDWIIAPKQYDANYCSGECPYSFLQKYPHTHIVHLSAPQRSGGPCCGPRKMSGISMLYFDHDLNIMFGILPGMVVESCGCSQLVFLVSLGFKFQRLGFKFVNGFKVGHKYRPGRILTLPEPYLFF